MYRSQIFRLLTVKFVSKIYKLKNRTHISSLIVYPVLLNPRLLPLCLQSLWSWCCWCVIFSEFRSWSAISHEDSPAIRQGLSLAWSSIGLDCLGGRRAGSSSPVSSAPGLQAGPITHGAGSRDWTHFAPCPPPIDKKIERQFVPRLGVSLADAGLLWRGSWLWRLSTFSGFPHSGTKPECCWWGISYSFRWETMMLELVFPKKKILTRGIDSHRME